MEKAIELLCESLAFATDESSDYSVGWREGVEHCIELLKAAQQTLALDPPSALECTCGSVAGIHCDWCPCAKTAAIVSA